MIDITSFVYCNGIEMGDKAPKLVAPLQFLAPISLPTQYSFSVSFGMFDLFGCKAVTMRYQFVDPQGNVVHDTDTVEIPVAEFPNKGKHIGLQANFDLKNILLTVVGEYRSIVYINGERRGEFPISVFIKEQ